MSEDQEREDPLDRSAELGDLWHLRQQGLLADEAWQTARALLLPKAVWRAWASRHLLLLGTALILAGVIYFFAYNWAEMDRLTKLGVAALGVVICAGAAQWVGLARLGGKVLLLSACVMVGILLAVFGQVYQTGADNYELFLSWAALIFLWVLISDFAALWFVWLLILNAGVLFHWHQVGEPNRWPFEIYFIGLAFLDAVALFLRELFILFDRHWLRGAWLRGLLLLMILIFLTGPMLDWIFEGDDRFPVIWSSIPWAMGLAAGFWIYRYRLRDAMALTLLALDFSLVLCCFLIEGVFETLHLESEGGFLLSGMIILGVVSGAAFGLKRVIAQMREEVAGRSDRMRRAG